MCFVVVVVFVFVFVFIFFAFSRAAPAAHGGSQARGLSKAVAAGYARASATRDPSCIFNLHHSSWQGQILNSLNKARD